jgi:hypothetical protein
MNKGNMKQEKVQNTNKRKDEGERNERETGGQKGDEMHKI